MTMVCSRQNNKKERERLQGKMKNKKERKLKKTNKQREARKNEMWAIHKRTYSKGSRASTPATIHFRGNRHSLEERLLAPGQNHCSAKLETGRTVGKAQIKNALPTWTQYTAALISHWKPKTQQHYFTS